MDDYPPHVFFLSIPGLRAGDLAAMPALTRLAQRGAQATLVPSFPAVTWPVQTNMLTGKLPCEHGVVANGFYDRDSQEVEMWTAGNEMIMSPQVWDLLAASRPGRKSAAWFPMLSKRCGADYICMPAPVHNPDGSESLWCYTRPAELYGELRDELGHFPLQNFWGPLAGIQSSAWILESAVLAVQRFSPNFFYIYVPHLDYAAQKAGPDSAAAEQAVRALDDVIAQLVAGVERTLPAEQVVWLAATEYVITPVNHVAYPNRILREAGLLRVVDAEDGELLDIAGSSAWCLVDHQCAHVFVQHADEHLTSRVRELFTRQPGIEEVLVGPQRRKYGLDHERSGELVLVSAPDSWQAYYWWLEEQRAPRFARTVDIHRKPGYDPVELFWAPDAGGIPLDATLVRGSHGAPAIDPSQQGMLLVSEPDVLFRETLRDVDVADVLKKLLGLA